MKLAISKGNIKLGNIQNVSFPPLITCQPNPPCKDLCYARKIYEGYGGQNTKDAWDRNWALFQESPKEYFEQIYYACAKRFYYGRTKAKSYFRFNVGGDIRPPYTTRFMEGLLDLGQKLPLIKFLIFTRNPKALAYSKRTHNVQLVESVWLGDERTQDNWPAFKVLPKDAPEVPGKMCPGKCSECFKCWHMPPTETIHNYLH